MSEDDGSAPSAADVSHIIQSVVFSLVYVILALAFVCKYLEVIDRFQLTIILVYIFGFISKHFKRLFFHRHKLGVAKILNWTCEQFLIDKDEYERKYIIQEFGFIISSLFFLILHIFCFRM